jgi:hypothetical protein
MFTYGENKTYVQVKKVKVKKKTFEKYKIDFNDAAILAT